MTQSQKSAESSDQGLIDLLRRHDALGISELVAAMQVTATAVRQRLNRLTANGIIERVTTHVPRGRPSHRYSLTEKGRRGSGNNFADLALVMWSEIREIKDPEVRSGLLQRLAKRMAANYATEIHGATSAERIDSIAEFFNSRNVPFQVEYVEPLPGDDRASDQGRADQSDLAKNMHQTARLPILTALACPYPDLAEQDRGICALENMVLTELVGERVKLTDCRLDGASCCRFQTTG
jgi:DeoR family transcriptional regulator, suf operon transcriptional repressor